MRRANCRKYRQSDIISVKYYILFGDRHIYSKCIKTHANSQDKLWDSENLGMMVYIDGLDSSGNALFLKLGSGHILVVVIFSIHLCVFEIFNTF